MPVPHEGSLPGGALKPGSPHRRTGPRRLDLETSGAQSLKKHPEMNLHEKPDSLKTERVTITRPHRHSPTRGGRLHGLAGRIRMEWVAQFSGI